MRSTDTPNSFWDYEITQVFFKSMDVYLVTGQYCYRPLRSLKCPPFSSALGTMANSPLILRTLMSSHPFRQSLHCPNVTTLAIQEELQ